ncbi:hypothetical protein [Streptomyces sp. NPDC001678]|uniref:hypothetical protein n=1 Tax=Streptomyces sp. NPDC001678 TaxID=3364599 RepID=UPI00369235BA
MSIIPALVMFAVTPSPPITVHVQVTELTDKELKTKITKINPFTVNLTPLGSGVQKFAAAVVAAFTKHMVDQVPKKVSGAFVGKEMSLELGGALGYHLEVAGVKIDASPANLTLTNRESMLLISGDLVVS